MANDEITQEKYVIDSEKLESLDFWVRRGSKSFVPFAKKVLNFLERFLGVKIYIGIPDGLEKFNSNSWPMIHLAYQLKRRKIINYLQKENTENTGDIRIVRFRLNMIAGADLRGDAHGYHISNEKKALESGIKSALKLYSLHKFYPREKDLIESPYEKIRDEALNLYSLEGISVQERANNSKFDLKFDDKTVFKWVKGHSLIKDKDIWIPIQLINSIFQRTHTDEPILRLAGISGMGAGKTLDDAILEGMMDLIEKDASMITWLNKISPPVLDTDTLASPMFRKIFEELRSRKLELQIAILPTDFSAFVILTAIISAGQNIPANSISSAADTNFIQAIEKSLVKVLAIRGSSIKNRILKKFSHYHSIGILQEKEFLNSNPPFLGRRGIQFLYARRRMKKEVRFLFRGEKINTKILKDYLPADTSHKEKLALLLSSAKKLGYEVGYVDVTPKKIKDLGMFVVSVIIPKLQPMHSEESLPYLSGDRLKTVPESFGYKPADEINTLPHPFYT